MDRVRRLLPLLIVVATIIALAGRSQGISALGTPAAPPSLFPTPTAPGSGGDEITYVSPQYGYTLTYDSSVWTVDLEDADPTDAYDQIGLDNGVSYVTLIGNPDYGAGEMQTCLDDYVAGRPNTAGVTGFDTLPGGSGEKDDRAYGLYTYTYQGNAFTEYIECRDLGSVTLVVFHDAATEAYDDEIAAREDLLAGLTPTGSNEPPQISPTAAANGVYESPTYGYTIPYGDGNWDLVDESSKGGVDALKLTNGTTDLTFAGSPATGDAKKCLADAVAALLKEVKFKGFNQAVNGDGDPFEGTGVLGSFTGYTDGTTGVYLECTVLPGQEAVLLLRMVVPLDKFGDEIVAVDTLLGTISLTPAAATAQATATRRPAKSPTAGETTPSPRPTKTPIGGSATPTPRAQKTPTPRAEAENSYTDSANGWSLTWNDTWNQTADPDTDGYLGLDDGTSTVIVSVLPDTTDAQACIRDQVGFLVDGDDVSNVGSLKDGSAAVRGGDASAAYAAYRYVFKSGNATVKMAAYYDCRILPAGDTALLIQQVVGQDAYASEAAAFQDLLAGLAIGNEAPPPEGTAEVTETSETTDANSYTNPTYGYSITWDDTWQRDDGVGPDDLELTDGTSTVSIMPYPEGDAHQCVEGNVDLQGIFYSDLTVAQDNSNKALEGGDAGNYFAVYFATDKNPGDVIIYFECRSLSSDASVLIQQKVPAATYNDEIAARTALLGNLVLKGTQ